MTVEWKSPMTLPRDGRLVIVLMYALELVATRWMRESEQWMEQVDEEDILGWLEFPQEAEVMEAVTQQALRDASIHKAAFDQACDEVSEDSGFAAPQRESKH